MATRSITRQSGRLGFKRSSTFESNQQSVMEDRSGMAQIARDQMAQARLRLTGDSRTKKDNCAEGGVEVRRAATIFKDFFASKGDGMVFKIYEQLSWERKDKSGVLRVGGRLVHADLKYEQKHQIILPQRHHVTELIIRNAHLSLLHAGPQATLYYIRQRYWPVRARSRIRQIIHECVICFKVKPRMLEYKMGDLLKERSRLMCPIANSSVDYCGLFWIKEKKERNRNKVKVCVSTFVCLSTKAVHLELVSDLTTEAFLAALKRFFSRRGKANFNVRL
ncbi:PREDICTED: uncharacterized protein LOC105556796 [Vollenhovia emeryi]|uniref:uncharacterized protein LOC105556796 n=1 Tax=Vollenhovia emeryi TaxID=411798 RepID=UPI0005F4CF04|nr:PREDICTED: uncharacterized protein LOC105556796 [Vollenhovia emeryi]